MIRVPLITRGEGSKIRLALNFFSFCVISTLLVPFLIRRRFDAILVYEPSPVTVGIPAIVLKNCVHSYFLLGAGPLAREFVRNQYCPLREDFGSSQKAG